ncbi:hypothetical protein BDZ89DRAFT_194087 [Hymenopellis radicata]|nr:hypothetical protein BDZ89DRAFT_194087 [Hymenopellis radicata]
MNSKQTDDSCSIRQRKAAQTIQRHWRKTKESNLRRETLSTDLRWKDAAIHAQLKMDRIAADKGKNSPKDRWKRAAFFVRRLQDGNDALSGKGVPLEKTGARVKRLETQHWLELIDGKHRYGSNLKTMAGRRYFRQFLSLARPW